MSQAKTTIITGAAGGIGVALTRAYLELGHSVVLTGRNAEKLSGLASDLNEPDRIATVVGDLQDVSSAEKIVSAAIDKFGPTLQNLVNNAGTFLVKPFFETTPEDLDPYLSVVQGSFELTRLAAMQMAAQGKARGTTAENGSIVFISTIFTGGFISAFPSSAVGTVKAAYNGFTKNTVHELASHGIRVNTLDLGVIETTIYGLDEDGLASLRKLQPLGINGTPESVADSVMYLTEKAPFTTGQVFAMDGGVSAGNYVPS